MNKENELVEKIARYIIENKATNQMAADHFGLSKSSIQKKMNQKLVIINPELYQMLKDAQSVVLKRSRVLGGKTGKRTPSITDFEAEEMALYRTESSATYQELEKKYGYSHSSIYDAIKRLDNKELEALLEGVTAKNKGLTPRFLQNKKDDDEVLYETRNKQK